MGNRTVELHRKTKETDINLTLDLDAKGVEIDTPVAFFNHMLTAMAFHGGFALSVKAGINSAVNLINAVFQPELSADFKLLPRPLSYTAEIFLFHIMPPYIPI